MEQRRLSLPQSPDLQPSSGLMPVQSRRPVAGRTESERRERASLRRLEAGEQRKRAARLAEALRNDSFVLRYLPRLDLASPGDGFVSAELWLGLPNRRRGLMPVAPLLRGIDRAPLRHEMLCHTLRIAAEELACGPPRWQISVPMSGQALADGLIGEVALQTLDPLGIEPHRIDILIDEAELVIGGDLLQQQIASLREAGIGVTLEGFGNAFGGLALLSRLPFTGLKLDRRLAHALVNDPAGPDVVLIRAAIDIARRYDVLVSIDGIETETELQKARELGIGQAQGPWVGPALPADVMRARLRLNG